MDYDTSNLEKLGKRRARLIAQTDEATTALRTAVINAKEARVPEEKIAALAGITRMTVRNWYANR